MSKIVKPLSLHKNEHVDNCQLCGIGGSLVVCDLCPMSYHLECINKIFKTQHKTVPKGVWRCPHHFCCTCGCLIDASAIGFCCLACPNAYCQDCIVDFNPECQLIYNYPTFEHVEYMVPTNVYYMFCTLEPCQKYFDQTNGRYCYNSNLAENSTSTSSSKGVVSSYNSHYEMKLSNQSIISIVANFCVKHKKKRTVSQAHLVKMREYKTRVALHTAENYAAYIAKLNAGIDNVEINETDLVDTAACTSATNSQDFTCTVFNINFTNLILSEILRSYDLIKTLKVDEKLKQIKGLNSSIQSCQLIDVILRLSRHYLTPTAKFNNLKDIPNFRSRYNTADASVRQYFVDLLELIDQQYAIEINKLTVKVESTVDIKEDYYDRSFKYFTDTSKSSKYVCCFPSASSNNSRALTANVFSYTGLPTELPYQVIARVFTNVLKLASRGIKRAKVDVVALLDIVGVNYVLPLNQSSAGVRASGDLSYFEPKFCSTSMALDPSLSQAALLEALLCVLLVLQPQNLLLPGTSEQLKLIDKLLFDHGSASDRAASLANSDAKIGSTDRQDTRIAVVGNNLPYDDLLHVMRLLEGLHCSYRCGSTSILNTKTSSKSEAKQTSYFTSFELIGKSAPGLKEWKIATSIKNISESNVEHSDEQLKILRVALMLFRQYYDCSLPQSTYAQQKLDELVLLQYLQFEDRVTKPADLWQHCNEISLRKDEDQEKRFFPELDALPDTVDARKVAYSNNDSTAGLHHYLVMKQSKKRKFGRSSDSYINCKRTTSSKDSKNDAAVAASETEGDNLGYVDKNEMHKKILKFPQPTMKRALNLDSAGVLLRDNVCPDKTTDMHPLATAKELEPYEDSIGLDQFDAVGSMNAASNSVRFNVASDWSTAQDNDHNTTILDQLVNSVNVTSVDRSSIAMTEMVLPNAEYCVIHGLPDFDAAVAITTVNSRKDTSSICVEGINKNNQDDASNVDLAGSRSSPIAVLESSPVSDSVSVVVEQNTDDLLKETTVASQNADSRTTCNLQGASTSSTTTTSSSTTSSDNDESHDKEFDDHYETINKTCVVRAMLTVGIKRGQEDSLTKQDKPQSDSDGSNDIRIDVDEVNGQMLETSAIANASFDRDKTVNDSDNYDINEPRMDLDALSVADYPTSAAVDTSDIHHADCSPLPYLNDPEYSNNVIANSSELGDCNPILKTQNERPPIVGLTVDVSTTAETMTSPVAALILKSSFSAQPNVHRVDTSSHSTEIKHTTVVVPTCLHHTNSVGLVKQTAATARQSNKYNARHKNNLSDVIDLTLMSDDNYDKDNDDIITKNGHIVTSSNVGEKTSPRLTSSKRDNSTNKLLMDADVKRNDNSSMRVNNIDFFTPNSPALLAIPPTADSHYMNRRVSETPVQRAKSSRVTLPIRVKHREMMRSKLLARLSLQKFVAESNTSAVASNGDASAEEPDLAALSNRFEARLFEQAQGDLELYLSDFLLKFQQLLTTQSNNNSINSEKTFH